MKKLIFTLFAAFFCYSLALNAQNSSNLSYNTDDSPVLSEEQKIIDKTQLKARQSAVGFKKVEKKAIPLAQEDLKAKAKQMNLDFAKKGLPFKTQLNTVGGKQYIQIVDLPDQNGMNPLKVKQ